ncbi:MAG: PD-(D/E)XK nuclease family protein, partial [Clostridia bacterium]|nr:PD-(D/E)XK nuclease family protein [Clostridia bacterium]
FLLSALSAVMRHYPQEDMLRLLKTDYAPLTFDERCRMENLILQYGIRGWKFTKPFVAAKDEGAELEEARQRLMEPLIRLETGLGQAETMDEALLRLMGFLDETRVYDHLEEDAQRLEQEHMLTEAAQLRQVWNTIMNLLDQAHDIGGSGKPTAEEIHRLLDAGLNSTEIAALPQSAGSLPCGLLGNIAVDRPRVTFILALNDGVLDVGEPGLIADEEQDALKERFNASYALSQDERFMLKRLELQKAVYSPSEKLYLSHAQALQDGTALRQLDLLARIRRIFPLLIEEGGVTAAQGTAHPYGAIPALESIGARLRSGSMTDEWQQAWHYLSEHKAQETNALCEAFRPAPNPAPLPAELVHSLYLERVTSVHRLEAFAVCPFRHFLRYVLKPVQRGEWAINRTDAGSFYHRALEGFTRDLQNLESWPDVTRAQVDRLMDRAAEGALDDLIKGVMGDSAVRKREYRQYKRLLQRVGWTFTLIARHSSFRMRAGDAELRFGYPDDGLPAVPLRLSDGSRVYLRGIIDRVERYEGDGGLAIRLIDFKTGNLNLQPEKIFWGAQLQLLIYMQAVLNAEPNGIPAGMYYFHLADPLLPDPDTKSDLESQLAKALGLKGLTLRDASIIRLMDDGKPPLSMPALLKGDGDFAANKPLATLEEMRLLIQHACSVAGRLAEEINTGEIAASPLAFPNEDSPCATCEAYDVCRRNAPNTGITPRTAEKMKFDELIDKIK